MEEERRRKRKFFPEEGLERYVSKVLASQVLELESDP